MQCVLCQARHALRPRRNLHSLAVQDSALHLMYGLPCLSTVSCCLLSNEEHRLPLVGLTRLNHFTLVRSVLRIAALLAPNSLCFKFTLTVYPERAVPSAGWALTGVSISRCSHCTELAHSFCISLENLRICMVRVSFLSSRYRIRAVTPPP